MTAPLRYPAMGPRRGTAIFLHGLGQTTRSWTRMVEWLSRHLPNIEWILPEAPSRPVTYYAGGVRSAWFDIARLPPGHQEWDNAGVTMSISYVESLIQTEVLAGVDPRTIVLVGFSQGAALSLLVAFTSLHDLGGVASLSGWVPHVGREHIIQVHTEPTLPVFFAHGRDDTEIPTHYSEEALSFLRDVLRLRHLTTRRYNGLAHAVHGTEMHDLVNWFLETLHLTPVINGI